MIQQGLDWSYDTCWIFPLHDITQVNYHSVIIVNLIDVNARTSQKLFNFIICIKASHDVSIITLRMHQEFLITVFWRDEFDFHC